MRETECAAIFRWEIGRFSELSELRWAIDCDYSFVLYSVYVSAHDIGTGSDLISVSEFGTGSECISGSEFGIGCEYVDGDLRWGRSGR